MAPDPSERALQSNRKECHQARDAYFVCMTDNGGEEKPCRMQLKLFKEKCPESWVAHFTRKHKFEMFKQANEEKDPVTLDDKYRSTPAN